MEHLVLLIFILDIIFIVALFSLLELYNIDLTLKSLVKVLRMGLYKPGLVIPILKDGDKDMLKFYLALPTKGSADVVSRELTVAVAGAEPVVYTLGGDEVASAEFVGSDNDVVVGSLVDVDDAGNKSQPSTFEFTLLDTIPPVTPGAVGLVVTGEE
jgi:hypothetical protein